MTPLLVKYKKMYYNNSKYVLRWTKEGKNRKWQKLKTLKL